MGIAIPRYLVKGPNRYYVLAFYGAVFGGVLPGMVGRWWFGSRQETKDGINTKSTAVFFKGLEQDRLRVVRSASVEARRGIGGRGGEGGGHRWAQGIGGGDEDESIEHFRTIKVAGEAGKRGHMSFNLRMGSADFGNVMLMGRCYLVLRDRFIPESIYTFMVGYWLDTPRREHKPILVMAFYGIVLGGVLSKVIHRWSFGLRQEAKDAINAESAAAFFKGLKQDSGVKDVVGGWVGRINMRRIV
ncbi:hypothetical protein D9758_018395 [Tetrapyrgos nigripes]|uniref:Uncharacterized protein n=1 Tax=Tetrapyrgos nigripes TaxID=182062 RepID=A0A8H5BSR2_9AGAR|nr:hypothetical protein D9758_018395 [Tetrapyrgos nigripes]